MIYEQVTEPFVCINIRDFLDQAESNGIGEDDLQNILSDFSSPKNFDVDRFLKKNAIEFTKKHQSITYLVFSSEDMRLAGYFSITMKPVVMDVSKMSNAVRKKLGRLSKFDETSDSCTIASYLIAQLGKNYSDQIKFPIAGRLLMDTAIDILHSIQYQLGGLMVYLECEEKEPLLHFYQDQNGFRMFGERMTEPLGNEKSRRLLQLMNFL